MWRSSPQTTPGATFSADLEPVAKQLRSLLPYRGLRVLESFVLRSREGLPASVVGKAGAMEGGDSAIFLVISAKVVE
jgi:hypothetical protein